jgi:aromatic ring-opening dioxygenase catalytic subunit (LigB family)
LWGEAQALVPHPLATSQLTIYIVAMLPTFYLPHGGGPCFFMDWNPPDTWTRMAEFLRGLDGRLAERPRALLVISAHWEAPVPTVTTNAAPPLYFDYYGFPPHTYQLQWPAPGSPALAARVRALLSQSGIESAEEGARGFDHGVFIPLKLSYPEAQLPTVQLSLKEGLDPAAHLAMGRALAPLRDEGVLILGSGMSYHNMRGFGRTRALAQSQAFDDWLNDAVADPEKLKAWQSAPSAREVHPREEHLIPALVAQGAGGPGKIVFRDQVMGVVVSAAQFG